MTLAQKLGTTIKLDDVYLGSLMRSSCLFFEVLIKAAVTFKKHVGLEVSDGCFVVDIYMSVQRGGKAQGRKTLKS